MWSTSQSRNRFLGIEKSSLLSSSGLIELNVIAELSASVVSTCIKEDNGVPGF